jgi:hypothetical protein
MSPRTDSDWQILMEATLVPPAERFPWNESDRNDDTNAPAPSRPNDLDARRESYREGGVILTPR